MKKDQHPQYQEVLFVDSASGMKFVCGSAVKSDQVEMYEGRELPVVVVSISSASHPFFVGGKQYVDTEGRVDRFKKRYQQARAKKEVAQPEVVEEVSSVKVAAKAAKASVEKKAPAKPKAAKKTTAAKAAPKKATAKKAVAE